MAPIYKSYHEHSIALNICLILSEQPNQVASLAHAKNSPYSYQNPISLSAPSITTSPPLNPERYNQLSLPHFPTPNGQISPSSTYQNYALYHRPPLSLGCSTSKTYSLLSSKTAATASLAFTSNM